MLLGPANVRATRKDGRYKVKEEYNAYRVGCVVMHCPLLSCCICKLNHVSVKNVVVVLWLHIINCDEVCYGNYYQFVMYA